MATYLVGDRPYWDALLRGAVQDRPGGRARCGIADALRARGSSEAAATLTASAAVTALQLATDRGLADPGSSDLGRHLRATVEELRSTAASLVNREARRRDDLLG